MPAGAPAVDWWGQGGVDAVAYTGAFTTLVPTINSSISLPTWSLTATAAAAATAAAGNLTKLSEAANTPMMGEPDPKDTTPNASDFGGYYELGHHFNNPRDASEFLAAMELPRASQITLIVLYITTIVLAVAGNLVAIVVLAFGNRSKKGVRNYLINLAISDLCMACFCMPFTFTKSMLGRWLFGRAMCPFVLFMQVTTVAVSVYTNVAIGIDRYLAVTRPVRQRLTKTKTAWIIAGTWLASAVFGSVQFYVGKVREIFTGSAKFSYVQCTEQLDTYAETALYSSYIFCFTYLIPLLILAFVYYKIGYALWQRQTPGNPDTRRDLTRTSSLKRVTRMLLIVVIAFALCWLPTHLFIMVIDFVPSLLLKINTAHDETVFYALFYTCHWLAMSNSVLNPIIYCFLNESFRADLRYLVRRNPCTSMVATLQMSQLRRERCGSDSRRLSTRSFFTRRTFLRSAGARSTSTTSESGLSTSALKATTELCAPGTPQLRKTFLASSDSRTPPEPMSIDDNDVIHKL